MRRVEDEFPTSTLPVVEAPIITRPDLERDQDVKPKALRPYRVIVLDCNCHTFDDVEIALWRIIAPA